MKILKLALHIHRFGIDVYPFYQEGHDHVGHFNDENPMSVKTRAVTDLLGIQYEQGMGERIEIYELGKHEDIAQLPETCPECQGWGSKTNCTECDRTGFKKEH